MGHFEHDVTVFKLSHHIPLVSFGASVFILPYDDTNLAFTTLVFFMVSFRRKVTHKAPPEGQMFPDVGSQEALDQYGSVNRHVGSIILREERSLLVELN